MLPALFAATMGVGLYTDMSENSTGQPLVRPCPPATDWGAGQPLDGALYLDIVKSVSLMLLLLRVNKYHVAFNDLIWHYHRWPPLQIPGNAAP